MPLSMIVVESSTLYLPSVKSSMTSSSLSGSIWPWPTTMRHSGTSACSQALRDSMVCTRLCTKKTCPPRASSRMIASRTTWSVWRHT
jgi:hypothetical protein